MDLIQLLEKRRTIRDFEERQVPLDIIKEIINDSIKAPNAGNRQPWGFIIINNSEWIKKLSDSSKKCMLEGIEKKPNPSMDQYKEILKNKDFNVFYNAPSLIYITGSRNVPTLSVDCALVAGYFMLSATSRGLGTCWVGLGGAINDPEIQKEIGLPENHKIIASLIIGYPKGIPPMPERKEPKILKIIN